MLTADDKSSILLPHIIEQNARADPNGVFARIPAGSKYTDGYRDVTKLQLHNAVNYTASLLKRNLGESQNFETLAYIGPGDLRYSIIVVAGAKAGYKIFLPSPRNSKEAHLSLLRKLECTKLVITEPQAPCIPMILGELRLQTTTLPSLQQLLEVGDVEEYPYEKSFEEARKDPAFVLHTSGSTGIPKHLTFTNEFISRAVATSSLPPPKGYVDINRYFVAGRFLMTLPSFHIAGLGWSLLISAYHGCIPIYTLPGPPPTPESFISVISNTEIDWAFVPPVFIDVLGKRPDLLDVTVSRLKYLFFTGGSVPKASGNVVAQRLPIWQVLGSSECGILPLVHPETGYKNSEDWYCVQLNPLVKSEMRHRLDDLHELVIVRNVETEAFQPVFTHFPTTTEYETRDLFRPHPSKQGLWFYQSRIDDVIVFLNGEKTNPTTFEEEVIGHPEVKAALVVGAQRLEAALLIELATAARLSDEEKAAVVERIWPIVDKANKATPAHARISRSKILLVDPDVPMLRAGKGTVQRNATLALYAEEIDRLYNQDETSAVAPVGPSAQDDIKTMVRNLVAEMLGLDDLDFFQLGMDSLMVLRLTQALKLRLPGASIPLNTVYSNSSVSALAKALEKVSATNKETTTNGNQLGEGIAKILEDFSQEIDAISPITYQGPQVPGAKRTTILLTGSTGALGSYILHHVLSLPDVTHIYCFNRTSDARDRQIKNNQARGLNTNLPPERVTFLVGDLAKHNFDLPQSDYQTLLSEVTHIIHNAWPVNFNLSLPSFIPSLSGVVSLVRFSSSSRWNSTIQFFSSISSVSSYPGTTVPEAVITELSTPAAMGYGQSKYIAERLLDHASKRLGINASSVRIGQIAGAAGTASGWNRQEWLPSLVTSSAFIGAIPETLGDAPGAEKEVNWVPIDQLADVLMELALGSDTGGDGKTEPGVSVFQVVHPNPIPWSSLLSPIIKTLEASSSTHQAVKIVPYTDWLSALKAKSAEAENGGQVEAATLARKNPAMKLLDFYESLQYQGEGGLRMKLSMEKTLKHSKTLRELEHLKEEWITGWVKEWMSV